MDIKLDFVLLKEFLLKSCPQEWLITFTETTTCQGKTTFILVKSAPRVPERDPICHILIKKEEIVIISPNIFWDCTRKVGELVRSFIQTKSPQYCLTMTECNLNHLCCPECSIFSE